MTDRIRFHTPLGEWISVLPDDLAAYKKACTEALAVLRSKSTAATPDPAPNPDKGWNPYQEWND